MFIEKINFIGKLNMYIHTINFNYNDIDKLITNLKIWKNEDIKQIIKEKYTNLLNYYNNLLLNKSRENIAKLILLNEYGGIYLNYNLLQNENINDEFIASFNKSEYNIIFYKSLNQNKILKKIYDIADDILTDDIIYIKESSNIIIKEIIENIDLDIIPTNEFQNKINLGNIFLSKHIYNHYENLDNNFNIINVLKNLVNYYDTSNDTKNPLIKIEDNFYNEDENIKIKNQLPKVIDLIDPDEYLIKWDNVYNGIQVFIQIMGIIVLNCFEYKIIIIFTLLSAVAEILLHKLIIYQIDIELKLSKINDNKIFFNYKKFPFLKELKKKWKIIAKEAKEILDNAPKLEISRTYEQWNDSFDYVNNIKDKYGWIKSWKNSKNLSSSGQETSGNNLWLNYGLIYYGIKFKENISKCPETEKILDKMIDHINICGFSYFKGNCIIDPHVDETGIKFNSLAFHLGLIIPKPNSTCKLIIKNGDEYIYKQEVPGDIIIFDATYEHYAYNQSNDDRIIMYMDFNL